MIITLREQVVIKEWNKSGIAGLRVSSLALLANIGGREAEGVRDGDIEGVGKVLIRHTMRLLPVGLWDKGEGYCREICFLAGVEFDERTFRKICEEELVEREDTEFEE